MKNYIKNLHYLSVVILMLQSCNHEIKKPSITFEKTYHRGRQIDETYPFDDQYLNMINMDYTDVVSGEQTNDDGYIILGNFEYRPGFSHSCFYIIKTNANGDTIWTKTYQGDAYKIIQANDSGYAILGRLYKNNNYNYGLIKTNSKGDILWENYRLFNKFMGNRNYVSYFDSTGDDSYIEEVRANSLIQTKDGSYVIVGTSNERKSNGDQYHQYHDSHAYLIKTKSNGDLIWTKKCGSLHSSGNSIQQTKDGGYIICGEYVKLISFNSGYNYADIIKTNGDGIMTWEYPIRFSDYKIKSEANSVIQANDGSYICTGKYEYGNKNIVFLIKISTKGDSIIFSKNWGEKDDVGYSVKQTKDTGYIITGYTKTFGIGEKNVYLIKTNLYGETTWTKTFGGRNFDIGYNVQQADDGGYCIIGYTNSLGAKEGNVYLIKTNEKGETIQSNNAYNSESEEQDNSNQNISKHKKKLRNSSNQ